MKGIRQGAIRLPDRFKRMMMKKTFEYEDLQPAIDKFVFSNPGTMLISITQYYRGGESMCRNKYLQTMFSLLGSAEKAGSGTDKIILGWESQKWEKPSISERSRPNKVILTMPIVKLSDEKVALSGEKVALSGEKVALSGEKVALRTRFEELKTAIVSYCTEWRSMEEIAANVGKQPSYLKNKIMPRLTDVLEKMYDVPHHPKQKYKAKQV